VGGDGYGVPGAEGDDPEIEKEKPDFGTSGLLAEETNTVNGVVVVYTEPEEARVVSLVSRCSPISWFAT
jgi:smad nuclear-interacting protein 1